MKKILVSALTFGILLVPITVFAGSGLRTWVSLSCNTLELKAGESAICGITLESSDKLAEYHGQITVSDGLTVDSITSKNPNYEVVKHGDTFTVSSKNIEVLTKQELLEVKVSAKQDVKGNKATIQLKTLQDCPDWLIGDANDDKRIDILDPLTVLQMSTLKVPETSHAKTVADMDGNGGLSAYDALLILQELQSIQSSIDLSKYEGKGDINEDGVVDVSDATLALQMSVELEETTQHALQVADFDNNGEISPGDALIILQINKANQGALIKNPTIGNYICFDVDETVYDNTSTIEFDVTPADEVVDVPDTASNIPVWYYVVGAVFMAFGVYLIVEARRKNQVQ